MDVIKERFKDLHFKDPYNFYIFILIFFFFLKEGLFKNPASFGIDRKQMLPAYGMKPGGLMSNNRESETQQSCGGSEVG